MSASISTSIETEIYSYGYPIVMVLGMIGNLFILLFFNRQRHSACSIYLVNSAVTNLFYLPTLFSFKTFSVAYNGGSMRALLFCKFSTYISGFLGQVTKTILIWACIDRYMMTSHRATFRAFSTPKRAKYLVFFTYIFWLIVASHSVIFYTISNSQCTRVGLYATIYTFYAILFVGLIPSIILSIFAYLTHRNMKHLRSRVQPINQGGGNTNHIIQRRDRDLLVLVIAEVTVYIITTAPFAVMLLEMMIRINVLPTASVFYFRAESFAFSAAGFLLYIFSATPFYTYMVSFASFRRDFRQLMMAGCRKIRRPAALNQFDSRKRRTKMKQETRV